MPESEAERNAIREQLERILSSPLFRKSKRFPNLLRFVVERSLHGHTEPLKERTLGIEVFRRAPDYDTNLDPVVRTTAVEIRKRIAQYYHEEGHQNEIRIDFPAGSYLPEFRMPEKPAVLAEPPAAAVARPVRAAAVVLGAVAVLAALWIARHSESQSALDRFWAPVLSSPDPVSVYIGGYATDTPPVNTLDLQNSEKVAFADATALARVTSLLVSHNRPYRIRFQMSSKLEDLRDGPAVLIGAFNNSFTLRLTGPLRFSFLRNPETMVNRIQDRHDPQNPKWSDDMNASYQNLKQDYAIVSRVVDSTTGRVVVTASGLAKFGTEAAGEFLTSRSALEEMAKSAPKDWDRRNMQIVIGTDTIGRSAGPPHVLATYFW
jgi:hypothetical protein